jgi:dihydrofolate synthase/folylpolyglutamate synthase
LDHQQFLGDTLAEIASQKAGIIKPSIPVIIGRKQGETISVFDFFANQNKSNLIYAENLTVEYDLDLKGYCQIENSKTVLCTIKNLQKQGWNIPEKAIKTGFKNTEKNTGILGRWTTIQVNPKVICDTGHNEDGVKLIVQQLKDEKYENIHIVWGMVNDKDISKILNQLPKNAKYYWCSPKNQRALDPKKLASEALTIKLNGDCFKSVLEAKLKALEQAAIGDLIFIGGSTFVVAEAL